MGIVEIISSATIGINAIYCGDCEDIHNIDLNNYTWIQERFVHCY